eukprot:COSAG01_NODE_1549_length_9945_cov_568.576376_7_plen_165_part_00
MPVCLSASAVAYASTRIESMFMYVGTAAGVAAKQVVDGSAAAVQDVDVSVVQDILVSTFKQTIHQPAPPPPPGPMSQYYNVSGAGSAPWNGQYLRVPESPGTFRSTSCSECSLYAQADIWRLAIRGKELLYSNDVASGTPPLTGWKCDDGKSPAPTLAAGPFHW